MQANFPNLRRLFIEARTEDEERQVSRKAVCPILSTDKKNSNRLMFTLVL